MAEHMRSILCFRRCSIPNRSDNDNKDTDGRGADGPASKSGGEKTRDTGEKTRGTNDGRSGRLRDRPSSKSGEGHGKRSPTKPDASGSKQKDASETKRKAEERQKMENRLEEWAREKGLSKATGLRDTLFERLNAVDLGSNVAPHVMYHLLSEDKIRQLGGQETSSPHDHSTATDTFHLIVYAAVMGYTLYQLRGVAGWQAAVLGGALVITRIRTEQSIERKIRSFLGDPDKTRTIEGKIRSFLGDVDKIPAHRFDDKYGEIKRYP